MIFAEDIGEHWLEHQAMGLKSGSNPFNVTLQTATDAGATTTNACTFSAIGNIFSGSNNTGIVAAIKSTSGTHSLIFQSDVSGSRHGFKFNTPNHPAYIMTWYDQEAVKAGITVDGEIEFELDSDDLFIHEKMSTVVTTGNFTPSAGVWDWEALAAGQTTFKPPDDCINLKHMVHQSPGDILTYRQIPADTAPSTLSLPTGSGWTLMSDTASTYGFRWVDPGGQQPSQPASLLQFDGGRGTIDEDTITDAFDEGVLT